VSRTETDLISDDEEVAVTIAYARGSQPGTSFKQWTKTAVDKKPEVSTSYGDDRAPGAPPVRPKPLPRYRQKVSTKMCSGKCCFRCGKESHFARDCDAKGTCHHISEAKLACEDEDHERCECECECGQQVAATETR